jgi:hypothetical protein
MRVKVVAAVLGALLAATSLSALTVDELDINFGLISIGNTIPGASGPPIITPLYGVSLPMQLSEPFFVEPMLEFYTTYYEVLGTNVAPSAFETGTSFLTLGMLLSLHGGARWNVSPVLVAGGSVGLDFLLRLPIEFLSSDPNAAADTGYAFTWFLTRSIYPEVRGFLRWQVTDAIGLVFNVRVWYPIFQLWAGGFPFPDQFMLAGGIGFAVKLARPSPSGGSPAK